MSEKQIGVVENYFSKIGVAAIKITEGTLHLGNRIRIKGATSDLTQVVDSMQVEHESVESAGQGDLVGLKVIERVRHNDSVFLVTEEE